MTEAVPPPPPVAPAASSNWRWLVGCGLIGVAAMLGCGVCGGLFFASIFSVMKTSPPYQMALAQVQNDPQVQARLGAPLAAGWWATGNLEVTNDRGRADLDFTVTGTRATADVHTLASKTAGQWKLTKLLVTYDNGESYDLLAAPK